ncbi:hypothetical protein [Chloroflexus sp.]|uniref:hypothetical protein n=1 Tax=Chloroflexus sp. TaxID=1904827 RepID=UPI00262BC97A|nr:hypothetical protein [uncultured Chloroflexus sp.]
MEDHNAIGTARHRFQTLNVEGTAVIILERDGSLSYYPPPSGRQQQAQTTLYAATPNALPSASLIERIVSMAFDLLGVHRLEVRIDESES